LSAPPNEIGISAITLKRGFELAQQAAFLWIARRFVARSSTVTFDALATLDARVSSIVSALSKRPGLAERFLADEPPSFTSGHAFVTAAVALRTGSFDVFDALVARLADQDELLSPLASALAWLEYEEVHSWVKHLLASPAPTTVRLGLMAAVAHRVHPGPALERALAAEDPRLRGSALEAVGRLGAKESAVQLRPALEDEDAVCRFWAAWSVVRFGDGAGIPVLGRFAVDNGVLAKPACDLALRALEPDRAVRTHARLASLTSDPRLGVIAAGIIGDPALADWLLAQMESPPLARLAGAAFCLMTGRDLRRDDLDADYPPDAPAAEEAMAGLPDGDEVQAQLAPYTNDDLLADESDDALAWPDLVKLGRWWNSNRNAFAPGTRYLSGLPIRQVEMFHVWRTGNQQQRAAAALELALLDPQKPAMDVTAPAHRQTAPRSSL